MQCEGVRCGGGGTIPKSEVGKLDTANQDTYLILGYLSGAFNTGFSLGLSTSFTLNILVH